MSLVEVMVALVIGLALAGAAILIYTNSKHVFGVHVNITNIQENGRNVMHIMQEDVRLAGYWGLNYQPSTIEHVEPIQVDNECTVGWLMDVTKSVDVLNNSNSEYSSCIPDRDYEPGTDILVVRRASSDPVAPDDIVAGNLYLLTSLTSGIVFIADHDGTVDAGLEVAEAPVNTYKFLAHAYYIRPWSWVVGDGIPTLVREMISGTALTAEPLVEYVEDFQVILGLDTDGDSNVDHYDKDGIDPEETADVLSVAIEVLVRASTAEADYKNERAYQLGDQTEFTPQDGFRRQLFRETIYLRNGSRAGSV